MSIESPRGAAAGTEVLFLNHASLLIRRGSRYLLTDPWHQKPAFGSWLPSMPSYVHPAYLAALGGSLSILISHGHDDHCDDHLLAIFDKSTEMITARFTSPSVVNRLRKLGFNRITTVDRAGSSVGGVFHVRGFVNPARSLDDATYTINTGTGLVIHANDNWVEFDEETHREIMQERGAFEERSVALFSQTNSASGYPMSYRIYTEAEKSKILRDKVSAMIRQGLRNARKLQLRKFFSYAGFAAVYVRDKPEYLEGGLLPTARYITRELLTDPESRELVRQVQPVDFFPGDVLDLTSGEVRKAFVGSDVYSDEDIQQATRRYYEQYSLIDACDTFRAPTPRAFDEGKLVYFLQNLDAFARRKIESDGSAFATVIGKALEIHLRDLDRSWRLVFGRGVVADPPADSPPNKRLITDAALMSAVLEGEILFENLYTGYEAQWERFPPQVYNRDIIMFVVMYSYVYKNRLCAQYAPR